MTLSRLPHDLGRLVSLILFPFLLLLIVIPPVPSKSQDDDEVVRVNTDLVVLNVSVADSSGKFTHGLARNDFKLFVDGKERTISTFLPEETPFVAAVLLDTSESMEQRLMFARSAAIRFLQELRQDDMAAVYRFDSETTQVQDYSTSRDLGDFAFSFRTKGMTALNDAILRASLDLRERTETRRAIIVLSDGADTQSSASANRAVETALASNATIFTVDMSSADQSAPPNRSAASALKFFASKTGGRYVATPGGPVMREAFKQIAEELSNQYTLAFVPDLNARDGRWHTLEIKVLKPGLEARTRKGYHAPRGIKNN